jgi:hypothetical protein
VTTATWAPTEWRFYTGAAARTLVCGRADSQADRISPMGATARVRVSNRRGLVILASEIVHGAVQECLRQPFRRRDAEAASYALRADPVQGTGTHEGQVKGAADGTVDVSPGFSRSLNPERRA